MARRLVDGSVYGWGMLPIQMFPCPGHVDKTPSLALYPNATYTCFSCMSSGPVANLPDPEGAIAAALAKHRKPVPVTKRSTTAWDHLRNDKGQG